MHEDTWGQGSGRLQCKGEGKNSQEPSSNFCKQDPGPPIKNFFGGEGGTSKRGVAHRKKKRDQDVEGKRVLVKPDIIKL